MTDRLAIAEGRYPTATRIITPTSWTVLTPLTAPFTPGVPPPEFRIDEQGNVYLRGIVATVTAPGALAALPADHAPPTAPGVGFALQGIDTVAGFSPATVTIDATGAMFIDQIPAGAAVRTILLDGIVYNIFT